MNIEDVKEVPVVESYLKAIFDRQGELMEEYKGIEGLPDWPLFIDNPEHQVWIKDFLWRVVEELAESVEASWDANLEHQKEEVVDSLHFAAELFLLTGKEPPTWVLEDIVEAARDSLPLEQGMDSSYHAAVHDTIITCGLIGNTLKNKRWKKSLVPTDIHKFDILLHTMFNNLIKVFVSLGCDSEEIYNLYFKKSEKNKSRIKSNY
jgi:hypothetical protein